MLLAIDVGNTNTVVGAFDNEDLTVSFEIHTNQRATGDELGLSLTQLLAHRGVKPGHIDAIAVSNVVPSMTRLLEEASARYFGRRLLLVGPGVRTGLRILTDDPRQVGADRIANSVAAQHLLGGPAVVVDFGTATTFDALTAAGDYAGGAIAPGLMVSHDALATRAANLSPVDLVPPPAAIGRNTSHSMQSGMVYGYVGLVEGLVTRIVAELGGKATVIATGGLASLVARHTTVIESVDEHLTLNGLRIIHKLNSE